MKPQHVYDVEAPRKPVNLSVNSDLLSHAKAAGINLSRTFEDAVLVKLRESLESRWLAENSDAIAAYNQRIEQKGVFAAAKRRF